MKIFARSGVENSLPWANFLKHPIAAVLSYKGCIYNCVTCGGSQHAYSLIGRRILAVKKPATVVDEMRQITEWIKAPVFVVGDLQVLGRRYVEELVIVLRQENLDAELIFEFFTPPSADLLRLYEKAGHAVYLQISPEDPPTKR